MSTVSVRFICTFCVNNGLGVHLRFLGRTGRAGKMGIALTFLTNDDDEVMCVKSSFAVPLSTNDAIFSFTLGTTSSKVSS
jgi:hypothetical protein